MEKTLTNVLERVLALLLLAILLVVVLLVVLRYGFNTSITGANEVIVILFAYLSVIAAAMAIGTGEHLSIRVLLDRLAPRRRRAVSMIGIGLVALIHLVALIGSVEWMRLTGGYLMPSTGLPRWVAQLCIPFGCVLALFYCGIRFTRLARVDEPAEGIQKTSLPG